ncbi:MAG: hypothetical protein ACRC5W_02480 [Cetobacterium sp.]
MKKYVVGLSIEEVLGIKHKIEGNSFDNKFLVLFQFTHFSSGVGATIGVFQNKIEYLNWFLKDLLPYTEFCLDEDIAEKNESVDFTNLKNSITEFLEEESKLSFEEILKLIDETLSCENTTSWGYNHLCFGRADEILNHIIEDNYF